MKVIFKFDIDEAVRINETGIVGPCRGNFINEDRALQVYVRYADTAGKVHEQWMAEKDLVSARAARREKGARKIAKRKTKNAKH